MGHRVRHKWSNLAHTHACTELPEINSEWRNKLASICFQVGILCCCLRSLTWEVGECSRLHPDLWNRGWTARSCMHISYHSKLCLHFRSDFYRRERGSPDAVPFEKQLKLLKQLQSEWMSSRWSFTSKKEKNYGKKCGHWKVHWICISSSLVKYVQYFWILYKEYDLSEEKRFILNQMFLLSCYSEKTWALPDFCLSASMSRKCFQAQN